MICKKYSGFHDGVRFSYSPMCWSIRKSKSNKVEELATRQEANCLLQGNFKWIDEEVSTSTSNKINGTPEDHVVPIFTQEIINEADTTDFQESDFLANERLSPMGNNGRSSDYKTLNRGISRATDNVNIVSRVRSEIALSDNFDEVPMSLETPIHTFTLPDFTQFPDDFREFLEKDLISISTQTSLENTQRLNWWTGFAQRLWPLSTSGDGNCLLHAASLGMWGFHDRLLTLRKALHSFLSQSPYRDALWRRWKRQQSLLNAQLGLVYSEVEWRREWNAIVSMASTTPRMRRQSIASVEKSELYGNVYESLEEIHVLALAHVLKRPIVVVADTMLKDMNGEALAPIPFGGIYLPLEYSPSDCHRYPLLLAYDGGHFSALVAMESTSNSLIAAIPLTDNNNELLPIQFSIDPGENETDELNELQDNENVCLLNEFLDLVRLDAQGSQNNNTKNGLLGSLGRSVGNKFGIKLSRSNSTRSNNGSKISSELVLCALLHTDQRHKYYDLMIKNYIQNATERFHQANVSAPRYGSGNSKFYAEAGLESHEKISQLTPVKPVGNNDGTLYLSNSTFYETGVPCKMDNCTFFGNPETELYCSQCYKNFLKS